MKILSLRDYVKRNQQHPGQVKELDKVYGSLYKLPYTKFINSINSNIGKINDDFLFGLVQKWKYGFHDIVEGRISETVVSY